MLLVHDNQKKVFMATKHPVHLATNTYFTTAEPTSFTEASKSTAWRQPMAEEFSALQRQGTPSLAPYSPDKHVVGCKWVFILQYNQDGCAIKRSSARWSNKQHFEMCSP